MSKFYVPTAGPIDWRRFLAHPDKQWKTGCSAKTLAHCWEAAQGLPNEIARVLEDFGRPVELLLAIPEHKVPLPGSSRGESQNDVFALVRAGERTVAVTVEGKVDEAFAQTMGEWLKGASKGKHERLEYIRDVLGIASPIPNSIYYQLLHRTASAVIEARRFKTDAAAMLVHSFSSDRRWFDAFEQFAALFGATAAPNQLVAIRPNSIPAVYIGWVSGDLKFIAV